MEGFGAKERREPDNAKDPGRKWAMGPFSVGRFGAEKMKFLPHIWREGSL